MVVFTSTIYSAAVGNGRGAHARRRARASLLRIAPRFATALTAACAPPRTHFAHATAAGPPARRAWTCAHAARIIFVIAHGLPSEPFYNGCTALASIRRRVCSH
ncbi:hypothetical protein [Burkholderia thailandensis]|uniref:hypothetical protein n=1 Tax=Burkholderia thailandensis TaxID=57975 RepID=UPI0018687795|nr:hypothetical protein [Burkholderia thailandensis]